MAENKKSIDGVVEKLALISDAMDSIFPSGRKAVVFELKLDDFKKVQNNFREIDRTHKQFKIDISGSEFIFLLDELFSDEKDKI
jgi:hypothetical protein